MSNNPPVLNPSINTPRDVGYFQPRIRAWNRFWFQRIPGHGLALFRILFGLYIAAYFLSFLPNVELAFSSAGVYSPFKIPDLALPPVGAWILYFLLLLVIGLFTIGFVTRVFTPVLLIFYLYYYFLSLAISNTSYDRLTAIFLTIACFSDLDRVWSVTALLRPEAASHKSVSAWGVRVIQMQMVLLYLGAGLYKLVEPSWHNKEYMRWTLIGRWSSPLSFALVGMNPPDWFFSALTYGTIVFEILLPFALFHPRFRKLAVISGCLFHLLIAVLFNIPQFLNCIPPLLLFLDPRSIKIWVDRWLAKFGIVAR